MVKDRCRIASNEPDTAGLYRTRCYRSISFSSADVDDSRHIGTI